MPKMIYICILLIYFKVISKKGGHYCPRLPYLLISIKRALPVSVFIDINKEGATSIY